MRGNFFHFLFKEPAKLKPLKRGSDGRVPLSSGYMKTYLAIKHFTFKFWFHYYCERVQQTGLNLKIKFTHTSAFNSPISDFVLNDWLFKISVWRIPVRDLVLFLLTPQGVENWFRKTVIFLVIQIQSRYKILKGFLGFFFWFVCFLFLWGGGRRQQHQKNYAQIM